MAVSLQKFREIVFQLLYSRSFNTAEGELALVMKEQAAPKSQVRAAKEKVDAIWEIREELDALIAEKATDYDLERISRIEKAILRMGLYELLHTDLPSKIALSEAVRLARKFSTAEASAFVNAILDAVYKQEKADEILSEKCVSC